MNDKFSTALPVRIEDEGMPIVQVDADGVSLDDPARKYSTATPVLLVDEDGAVDYTGERVFGTSKGITPSDEGLPVIAVDGDGNVSETPLGFYNHALALDFKQSRYRTPLGYSTDLMAMRGPELVTNGTFDAGTAGWGASRGVPTISNPSGVMRIENSTAAASGASLSGFAATVGRTYEVTITRNSWAGATIVSVGGAGYTLPSAGTHTVQLTATTTASLEVYINSTTLGHFTEIDNVSLKEVPATYARTGAKAELAATTGLVSFAANVPGIVPGVGYWSRGAVTNKCTNYNANPDAVLLNMAGTFGGATITRELRPDLIAAAGLSDVCTSGYVYKAVLPGGTTSGFNISGPVGNANPHTMSIWSMVETAPLGSGEIYLAGATSNQKYATLKAVGGAADTALTRRSGTATPVNTADAFRIRNTSTITNDITVYFILNQLVEGTQAGPIIVTTGAAATVGADDMRLASPITADEDFITWVSLAFKTAPDASDRPVGFSDGTANNRFIFERNITTGALQGAYAAGGGPFTVMFAPSISQTTAGRASILIRRRAGKWTVAAKNSAGAANISTEEPVTTFPTGLNRMDVGHFLGGQQPKSPVEFVGIRRGTFTDAECLEILENA